MSHSGTYHLMRETLSLVETLSGSRFPNLPETYMIIVADAADIVCGAKNFMWRNFVSHENVEQFAGISICPFPACFKTTKN